MNKGSNPTEAGNDNLKNAYLRILTDFDNLIREYRSANFKENFDLKTLEQQMAEINRLIFRWQSLDELSQPEQTMQMEQQLDAKIQESTKLLYNLLAGPNPELASWNADPATLAEIPLRPFNETPFARIIDRLKRDTDPAKSTKGTPPEPSLQTRDNMGGIVENEAGIVASEDHLAEAKTKITKATYDATHPEEAVKKLSAFYEQAITGKATNIIRKIKSSANSSDAPPTKAELKAIGERILDIHRFTTNELIKKDAEVIESFKQTLRETRPNYKEIDINVVAYNKLKEAYNGALSKLGEMEDQVNKIIKDSATKSQFKQPSIPTSNSTGQPPTTPQRPASSSPSQLPNVKPSASATDRPINPKVATDPTHSLTRQQLIDKIQEQRKVIIGKIESLGTAGNSEWLNLSPLEERYSKAVKSASSFSQSDLQQLLEDHQNLSKGLNSKIANADATKSNANKPK